ncbi:MAG: hypothetical protein WBQ73_00285 [Candidatus Babeliales bacterium]
MKNTMYPQKTFLLGISFSFLLFIAPCLLPVNGLHAAQNTSYSIDDVMSHVEKHLSPQYKAMFDQHIQHIVEVVYKILNGTTITFKEVIEKLNRDFLLFHEETSDLITAHKEKINTLSETAKNDPTARKTMEACQKTVHYLTLLLADLKKLVFYMNAVYQKKIPADIAKLASFFANYKHLCPKDVAKNQPPFSLLALKRNIKNFINTLPA